MAEVARFRVMPGRRTWKSARGAPEKISTAIAWLIGRATASGSEAKVADKARESC